MRLSATYLHLTCPHAKPVLDPDRNQVRLAVLRYIEKPAPDDPPTRAKGSVAEALALLMERHVTPFATFEARD